MSALLKVCARLRRRTRLNGRLVRNDCRLQDQNIITGMWQLICSQEDNTGSSRSRREMINLTAISLSSLPDAKRCRGHKHVIANVFSHCLKMGCFDFIVIFLYKSLTHLSGFGFISCKKKRRLRCCIVCTAKHVHVQYKQHNLRSLFLWPTLYIPVYRE